MPYESFKCSHHVSIRGLVQDRTTGSWRYLIQVKRVMQDDACPLNSFIDTEASASAAASPSSSSSYSKALWQRRSSSSFAYTSPSHSMSLNGSSHVYRIRRSFAEFKLLHAAMKPLMRGPSSGTKSAALPSLPVDSVFAFFLGETQTMLQKKRLALENILIAIENHSAASDSSEYLEFLAKTDTYEQVSRAPLSPPPCSLASTASPTSSSGEDNENSSEMMSRSSGAAYTSRRRASRPELLERESSDDQRVPRRFRSDQQRFQTADEDNASMIPATEASEEAPLASENRVVFHRYSLV